MDYSWNSKMALLVLLQRMKIVKLSDNIPLGAMYFDIRCRERYIYIGNNSWIITD